jgi:membrane-associated phospholipid phosphatase
MLAMNQRFAINLEYLAYATVACALVLTVFYYWFDIAIMVWFKNHISTSVQCYRFSTICGNIFRPSHWLVLGIAAAAFGCYARFIMQQKTNANAFFFFACCVILAYVVCAVLKITLARYRPIEFYNYGLYGFHFFSFKYNFNSMPSGHATMAFAGLCSFARLFKRHWLTFLCLGSATIISLTRLVIMAHYPSDIMLGGFIGIMSVLTVEQLRTFVK